MGNCNSQAEKTKFSVYAVSRNERVMLDCFEDIKQAKKMNQQFLSNNYLDNVILFLKNEYINGKISLKQMMNFKKEHYDMLLSQNGSVKYGQSVDDEALRLPEDIVERIVKFLSVRLEIVAQ